MLLSSLVFPQEVTFMARLGIVAASLALMVGALVACTRTVERVVLVTETPTGPSPTPEPNLSPEEAIGLVWQRQTRSSLSPCDRDPGAGDWKGRSGCECLLMLDVAERAGVYKEGTKTPGVSWPEWQANLEATGRWRVGVDCSAAYKLPGEARPRPYAEWTVDDETLRVIPVSGWAD
jgi:hypothetical protein